MKPILAIAAAHIRQEGKIVLLPLVAGIAVLILRLLGGVVPQWVPEDLGLLAGFGLPSVAAVLLGLNLVGPDLRQRRLSFYFSRPCAPLQLWSGRLLGAMAVLAGSFLLGGPMAVASSNFEPRSAALVFGSVLLFLLVATNAATCVLSSPSWDAFVFDLFAATAVMGSAYWSLERALEAVQAPTFVFDLGGAILGAAAFGLLPASLAYLWGGKGRARWGHRWFSWTYWSLVGLAVFGINAWRLHEVRTPLSGILRYPSWGQALDAKTVLLNRWGQYPRWFLINVETGASARSSAGRPVISSNGEFAAWSQYEMSSFRSEEFNLVIAKTASVNEPLRKVKVTSLPRDISDDGERALFRQDHGLEVIDTHTGAVVGRVPLPESSSTVQSARLIDDHSIEAMLWEESVFRRVTFAFNGAVLREERVARPPGARLLEHAPTGRRAVIGGAQTVLCDRNGKPLGTLAGANRSAFFARDGSLLVVSRTPASYPAAIVHSLVILAGDGTAARSLPISGGQVEVVGVLSTGEIVVQARQNGRPNSLLVDPATLTVRITLQGVEPVWVRPEFNDRAGPVASDTMLRVFQNEDGDLLYLDPGATRLRLLIKSTRGDF